jgi:cytochrome c oxidase assembly protein Cox11
MPVLFYMDPELLDDEQMKGVNDVTLSYTFFEAADSEGIDASVAAGATLGIREPRVQKPARSNY